ncbi:MAG: hypothetical protein JO307_06265 [Bryobacterales bacterium]|nr:hypothetical protein [Bryobacterales bacterium]MBV9397128.1 hypothetical protein [Bryobacterales bacterium]
MVDTLPVNQAAADLLREVYRFADGFRIGIFDDAAAQPSDVVRLLKGLDGLARQRRTAAADIAAELRKPSKKGWAGVAIATPESEAHEQLHSRLTACRFDPAEILSHAPTRLAVMEARSRG